MLIPTITKTSHTQTLNPILPLNCYGAVTPSPLQTLKPSCAAVFCLLLLSTGRVCGETTREQEANKMQLLSLAILKNMFLLLSKLRIVASSLTKQNRSLYLST